MKQPIHYRRHRLNRCVEQRYNVRDDTIEIPSRSAIVKYVQDAECEELSGFISSVLSFTFKTV